MNHCIQGGVGDGDGSEDGGEAAPWRRAAAAAVAQGLLERAAGMEGSATP